ncbi:MAG: VUT family protein [bacterium]|nr:VUT family protein [bacterium]
MSSLFYFSILLFYLSSLYLSGMLNINNNLSYTKLFEIDTRLVISSLISLAISLYLNGQIYYIVRKVKNKMWLSNLLSIIVVQFLDTILFILIYFLGNLPIIDIALMMVIRYTFKLIIGIAATGIIYKGNRLLR